MATFSREGHHVDEGPKSNDNFFKRFSREHPKFLLALLVVAASAEGLILSGRQGSSQNVQEPRAVPDAPTVVSNQPTSFPTQSPNPNVEVAFPQVPMGVATPPLSYATPPAR